MDPIDGLVVAASDLSRSSVSRERERLLLQMTEVSTST